MKKITFLLVMLSCFFVHSANAQSKSEIKLLNALEQLRNAMINADSVMLDKLTASQLSYGHSGGHIDNKQEFVSKIASGKSDFVTMNITDQTIAISKNTAIVRHKLDAGINDNNKPGEVHLLVLLIWQKQKGQWKLLARQAVKQQ